MTITSESIDKWKDKRYIKPSSIDRWSRLHSNLTMDGTIIFWDLKQLAEFLKAFEGSTTKFTVTQDGSNRWVLTFTGGF